MGQIDGNRKCKYEEICNVVVIVSLFVCCCFFVFVLMFSVWGFGVVVCFCFVINYYIKKTVSMSDFMYFLTNLATVPSV